MRALNTENPSHVKGIEDAWTSFQRSGIHRKEARQIERLLVEQP